MVVSGIDIKIAPTHILLNQGLISGIINLNQILKEIKK
jgi:hypothetical protein